MRRRPRKSTLFPYATLCRSIKLLLSACVTLVSPLETCSIFSRLSRPVCWRVRLTHRQREEELRRDETGTSLGTLTRSPPPPTPPHKKTRREHARKPPTQTQQSTSLLLQTNKQKKTLTVGRSQISSSFRTQEVCPSHNPVPLSAPSRQSLTLVPCRTGRFLSSWSTSLDFTFTITQDSIWIDTLRYY